MGKAIILIADGFEEIEALSVVDILRRANIICDICSIKNKYVIGSHNITIGADITIDKVDFDEYSCLILPGGMPGSLNLQNNNIVIQSVKDFMINNKIIAAICAAPIILNEAEIINSKKVTSHPSVIEKLGKSNYIESVTICDNNIITSRGPATAIYFALEILKKMNVSQDKINELKKSMMVEFLENEIKNGFL